jgi:hypothetical protein
MRVISPPVTNGFNIQSHQAPRQRKLPANDQSEITKCEKSEQHVRYVSSGKMLICQQYAKEWCRITT